MDGVAEGDALVEEELGRASGGHFNKAARVEAIGAALPLLGTYFVSGSTALEDQAGLQRSNAIPPDEDIADLLAALQLRTAIAAAEKLLAIIDRIALGPNFRYRTEREESVGVIRGRLDVLRYSRESGRTTDVLRYPILVTNRSSATAENVLAAAAAMWLINRLASTDIAGVAKISSPETKRAESQIRALEKALQSPTFRACREAATTTVRRGLSDSAMHVQRRVDAGHVPADSPYADLVEWVLDCLAGEPAAAPGDLDWSFYGEAFDTKLFEIWCLTRIAQLVPDGDDGPPPRPNLMLRKNQPVYSWTFAGGTIHLHFQNSLTTISKIAPRWTTRPGGGKKISGIPDIVLTATPASGNPLNIVIDPKLRQRPGEPTDELYKIIGYFGNYALDGSGKGAVLYYSASSKSLTSEKYESDDGGELFSIELDPSRPTENTDALKELIGVALQCVDISLVSATALP